MPDLRSKTDLQAGRPHAGARPEFLATAILLEFADHGQVLGQLVLRAEGRVHAVVDVRIGPDVAGVLALVVRHAELAVGGEAVVDGDGVLGGEVRAIPLRRAGDAAGNAGLLFREPAFLAR